MSQLGRVIQQRKLKLTPAQMSRNCASFGRNALNAADLFNYETVREEILAQMPQGLRANFQHQPLSKPILTSLEYHEVRDQNLYFYLAVQSLSHQVAVEEVRNQNLKELLRLLPHKPPIQDPR